MAGGVEDIEQRDLVVNDALLSVRVCDKGSIDTANRDGIGVRRTLDCWVVFIDEMTLNQLNRKTRFTDTTSADNHQFVLSQKLLATIVSRLCATRQGAIGNRSGPEQELARDGWWLDFLERTLEAIVAAIRGIETTQACSIDTNRN